MGRNVMYQKKVRRRGRYLKRKNEREQAAKKAAQAKRGPKPIPQPEAPKPEA